MQLQEKFGKVWRFKDDELFEFTKRYLLTHFISLFLISNRFFDYPKPHFYRFESSAVNHKLSFKKYRESLGIMGVESLSFMCDRMFNSMDKDKDGFVSLMLS